MKPVKCRAYILSALNVKVLEELSVHIIIKMEEAS